MAVVLVLDDEPAVLDFVRQCIERHGHTPVLATSPQEGIRLATDRRAELAILDLDLRHPQINGLAVWSVLKKQLPGLAGLLLTGRATRQHAFEGGRLGIGGLIEKPFRAEDLALAMDAVMGAVSPGRHAVEERDGDAVFDGMVGKSPAMRMVFKFIRAAASSEYPVLILGETGTGKELVARSIHKRSPRNGGPLSLSTVRRFLRRSSSRSSSATNEERLPAPRRPGLVISSKRAAARSSSTKSATCPSRRRPSCCALSTSGRQYASAAASRAASTLVSWPRLTSICRRPFGGTPSGETCTGVSGR